MKTLKLSIFILSAFALAATTKQESSNKNSNEWFFAGLEYFRGLDPIGFLDSLRHCPSPLITVNPSLKGWIKESDIPKLIRLLDCQDSCANVNRVESSFRIMHRSTIGHEAAYLIFGFRSGNYPPRLNSTQYHWTKPEIISRWNNYQSTSKPRE